MIFTTYIGAGMPKFGGHGVKAARNPDDCSYLR